MDRIDYCVVGGGVIGLFIAKKLIEKHPNKDIFLLEESPYLGDQSTGRNSGVLHAGMYYKTDSLKHKLCLEGNKIWKELATQFDFNINHCGKYIIACNESELQTIEDIYQQGKKNNVSDLRRATQEEIADISNHTNVVSALYSPSTASLDVASAIKELDRYILNKGVFILKNEKVSSLKEHNEGIVVKTNSSEFLAEHVFNCAGNGAVKLRKTLGLHELENRFVKGSYLKTTQKFFNEALIYPVPFKDQKGLGVHTVLSSDGNVLFGPDAEVVTKINYEVTTDAVRNLKESVSNTFKGVEIDKLSADYAGIRSQICYNNETYPDFWIKTPHEHKISGYFECLGIESPGLTAAPAIANLLVT
jgi:L-2-hydroxyglutarate oxidase LhgO